MLLHLNSLPPRFVASFLSPLGLSARSLVVGKGITRLEHFNRDELRVVEMPAANGTGTAQSLAKLYGSAATGGSEIGLSPAILDALKKPAVPPTNGLRDKVLHIESIFSLGFCKPVPICVFGSSGNAFGTPGAGGSFGFADPDTGIGYGYVMNKMGFHLVSDPREVALRNALFRDTLGTRPQA
jgi:CubicO group peptidase (beta-lactamase class C family)